MTEPNDEQYKEVQFAPPQELKLSRIETEGYILDIGGGGEGVLGQLEGTRVVAIDIRKEELEEAKVGKYLRIVMDATDLQFLDSSFATVTAFFSMMYMKEETMIQVFQEIYRVLASGGEFWLWDLIIPKQYDDSKKVYAIMLKILLPDREIGTGYGCPWTDREQNVTLFKKMGTDVGLKLVEEVVNDTTFFLKFRKE